MSTKKIIAISAVGLVAIALVVTIIILAVIPSTAHALVRDGGYLTKPTEIYTYRYIDNTTVQRIYVDNDSVGDATRSRYNEILNKINNQSGLSVLSGMFSQNQASKPEVKDIDTTGQYWNGLNPTGSGPKPTAEKLMIVFYYNNEQTVMNGNKEVKFNRAYFTVSDTLALQSLKVYLLNGTSTASSTMITYTGNFSALFDYVMELPTGATSI